jgi:curved DNA-binding protein CbpA
VCGDFGLSFHSFFFTALILHPDKQKNPTAETVKAFHRLQVGYELLTDTEARKAFDALLGAKVRQQQRKNALSSKRKELQEELERREAQSAQRADLERAEAILKSHLDRLRQENLEKMRRETEELMKKGSLLAGKKRDHDTKFDDDEVANARPQQHHRTDDAQFVPYSQQFQTLDEFEKFAFAKLLERK